MQIAQLQDRQAVPGRRQAWHFQHDFREFDLKHLIAGQNGEAPVFAVAGRLGPEQPGHIDDPAALAHQLPRCRPHQAPNGGGGNRPECHEKAQRQVDFERQVRQ